MKPTDDASTYHPGGILAADPGLMDPNFRHTLVYLASHSAEGAFGLVMNRPLGKTLGELPVQVELPKALSGVPVYAGGPVRQEQLMIAVFEAGPRDVDLACRLEVDTRDVVQALGRKDRWVRAFLGYAGWGEGQLDQELSQRAWKVCRPSQALFDERLIGGLWSVFAGGDDRWRELLPFLPVDPGLN
jgi:putative transcriptional regulator